MTDKQSHCKKDEIIKEINRVVEDNYDSFLKTSKNLFRKRGKVQTGGKRANDIVQEGILDFVQWIREDIDDIDEFMEDKLNDNYIYSSITNNIKTAFMLTERKQGVQQRMQDSVRYAFFFDKAFAEFEEVEVKEFKQEISSVKRSLVRMLEEGCTVQEIIDRLNLSSVERYYDILNALKKRAEQKGYTNNE